MGWGPQVTLTTKSIVLIAHVSDAIAARCVDNIASFPSTAISLLIPAAVTALDVAVISRGRGAFRRGTE